MKRRLARDIDKSCKEINKQVETGKIGNKLLNSDSLTLVEISYLGQCFAEQQGYDKNQLIVCNVTELNEHLLLHKGISIEHNPLFIICDDGKNNWVTLCITKLSDKTLCLYNNFLNMQMSESIKILLEQQFGKNIEIKIHNNAKMSNQIDSAFLSLKTLETMMVYLKVDKRMDFIQNFTSQKKPFFGWLKDEFASLKDELFSLVKEGYYKTVASDIDQLSRDVEFKKALNEFINRIPLLEHVEDFKNYQNILKEFVEAEESGINTIDKIKKLEEAREKVLRKTKELKIETSKDINGNWQLNIAKTFPTQMEKFTRIFEPLVRSKVDEKLDKTLEEICKKLDIEYNKLKSFFRVQEERKQDNNNVPSIRNIEDIINSLPKSKNFATSVKNANKPYEQILSEITVERSDNSDVIKPLEEGYKKVKEFYKLWEEKDVLTINLWAISKKGQLADSEIYEAVAVMDRANELVTGGHRLHDTQILSVLTFLQKKYKGQLAQIQTGEGKTTIVSILAAIKALQGETVDIITSNPVLASDGIKDKIDFYSILSLSATTNNLDENYKKGERKCYKADIVYGSISNFQFDYLKDSFLGLKTRAGRLFKNIILDEVDSMIIDNASHIAKLSGSLPGMESLKYIYIKIWQELHKAEKNIIQEFQEKLKQKAQELDLQKLLEEDAEASYKEFENELKFSIIQKIKDYIKLANPTKIDIIPSHIQNYADHSLDRWIDSAIDAKFNYHEDEQYVIRISKNGEEVVQPVDYANTGITLKNTVWQYGLHQFLQLKHNLHLTSESLTTCFISNLGYINKYGDKIFGLTGTLGSEAEQELLSSIYNVDYAKIPTYKEKRFTEIDGEVVDDEIFSEKVADDTLSKVDKGQSSLIICETIKDAKTLQEVLKRRNEDVTIRTFFDEGNAHITKEEINPAEVVIATNIAGRGTDFKTSAKLESNGGLQVCVAFLPCNKRVEDQAFGRTARQGNNGTGMLVIKKSEIEKLGIDSYNFKEIKMFRDLKEKERIKQIKEVKILELQFQDELFELFSTLYRKLLKEDKSEGEYQYALDDLKEFWAFWLEEKNFSGLELADKSPKEEFKDFESRAHETIKGKIQFNPYYSIQQAEHFILNEKLDEAENALNHAIEISKNPEILHSAYIKLFEIAVEKGKILMNKFQKAIGDIFVIPLIGEPDRAYKENAKKYLMKAKEALKKEYDYIEQLFKTEEFTNIITSHGTKANKKDNGYWFNDDDMHTAGEKVLESLVKNICTQFINRLTRDQIENFCKNHQLQEELPVFICYNICGNTNKDSGIHWISMCIVKIRDRIRLFYKDSKSNFANNMKVVEEEFKKCYKNLDFFPHTHAEQSDDSSCGPMTLQNLRIMAQSIEKNGIEKFTEIFTSLRFSQQNDVLNLRDEFVDILPNKELQKIENLFLKHVTSKQHSLSLNMGHTESLIQQINEHEGDISINCRISDYFFNLKPENDVETDIKNAITNSELSELAAIGTNTTYALREVHDVCPEIVKGAQIQIGGGIALYATGICFPPSLPVTSAIGATMITEGLCDIAIELICKNSNGQFDKDAYVKGKVISYGLSILTMGISAAMQCPKILNAAKKACRWISATLRKCPYLKGACEFLATKFDKLGDWFKKMATIAKFNSMSKAEKLKYIENLSELGDLNQLKYLEENIKQYPALLKDLKEVGKSTYFETCISAFKKIAVGTTKRVVENVIMDKVTTPALSSLLLGLKPKIKEIVTESVKETIDEEILKSSSYEDIQNIIKEIRDAIDYETIEGIFKATILALTKYCSDWRVQLCALAVDQFDSWKEVYTYVRVLCKKINDKLKPTGKAINNVKELINQLIEQFSEEMYRQFVSTTIKTCQDVYFVGKSVCTNYAQEKKEEAKCLEINKDFEEGGQAGQEQAKALSDVKKRPIYIYDEKGNMVIIGKQYLGDPIEVSFFPPDDDNPNGHYVPCGKDRNWVLDDGRNNCLFNAVGFQTGDDPNKLRKDTIHQIRSDPSHYIASHVHEVMSETKVDKLIMKGGDHKRGSNAPQAKKQREQEKERHKIEIERLISEYSQEMPPHSKRGSAVLKESDGVIGEYSNNAGHATDHLTHSGFSGKESHTVFANGKEQVQYLADMASQHPEFQAKAKEIQNTRSRVVCTLPIKEILKSNLPLKIQEKYMQATARESAGPRNIKFVTFVLDPAVPGSGRPYHIQTMFPVIK